jgi:hypothetical protein
MTFQTWGEHIESALVAQSALGDLKAIYLATADPSFSNAKVERVVLNALAI